jgi:hypothetical protein
VQDGKKCSKCKEYKEASHFYSDKRAKSGLRCDCIACGKKAVEDNRHRVQLRRAAYRSENRELLRQKQKEYALRNREEVLRKKREYKKNNRHMYIKDSAKRRASKLKATPSWLTEDHLKEIKEIYKDAQEIRWLNEEPLHVDHIVPLQGKNVSGLHVPWNLQILTASVNLKKGNQ